MKYNIPEHRELNEEETSLLKQLFTNEKPEWTDLIEKLKVIVRCGCGKCPTIMFGKSFESKVLTNQSLLIDYVGKNEEGNLIGILLFGSNKFPSELEFYSIDSLTEIIEISKIHSIK